MIDCTVGQTSISYIESARKSTMSSKRGEREGRIAHSNLTISTNQNKVSKSRLSLDDEQNKDFYYHLDGASDIISQ